uniref:Uncharacterized protein n=1 Tax=viral metagenome TaxID=1070528 RepID=A0A6M3J205_9ZZZZ
MADKGAIRPEIFTIKGFIQQDKKDDEHTVEEKILATGANNAFWKTLKKHFENSIQQLDRINEEAIAGGMPLEEIGRNALVISQVKGVLNKIMNVVEDAKEALDGGEAK